MNEKCLQKYDSKKWFPDDMKRSYFYILENEESTELFECIKKLDDYMINEIEINKKNWFMKNDEEHSNIRLTYKRIVTTDKPPNVRTEENDDNNK